MRFDITRRYSICLHLDDDDPYDCVDCSLSVESTGSDSYLFTVRMGHYDCILGLMGINAAGLWYLDPALKRGFSLELPVCYESVCEELLDLGSYDSEQCMVIAKSIDLIYTDFFHMAQYHIFDRKQASNTQETEFPF